MPSGLPDFARLTTRLEVLELPSSTLVESTTAERGFPATLTHDCMRIDRPKHWHLIGLPSNLRTLGTSAPRSPPLVDIFTYFNRLERIHASGLLEEYFEQLNRYNRFLPETLEAFSCASVEA